MYTMHKIPTLSPDNHCTVHILDMYTIYVHHVQDPNPFYGYPLCSTYIKHVKNVCTPCIRYQPFLQTSTVQYTYIKHVQCTQYVNTMFKIPTLSPDIHCTVHILNVCTIVYTIYKIPTLSPDSHCTVHILNKYTIYVHHV